MQPWIVDLSVADEITLYIDKTRLLPVTDPFNRQITIGCGAFLELLVMALAEFGGVSATTDLFPRGEAHPLLDDRPLFRVRLASRGATRSPLFSQILNRRTNRGPFTEREVDPSAAASIHRRRPTCLAAFSRSAAPTARSP